MWIYEKKLQYPVKIKNPNPKLAQLIISQLGGPDGEIGASMRYLHQRYSMPYKEVVGILTDIGTEELAHVEMISAILYQLTRNLTEEEIAASSFATYFVDHTTGVYPVAASGVPFDMKYIGVKGDVIADLNEDLAADAAILQAQQGQAYGVPFSQKPRADQESSGRPSIFIVISAQIFPRHNGVQRIAELDENTRQKCHLIRREMAGDGIGERRHHARQFHRFLCIQCSSCSASAWVLCTVPKGC